MSLPEKSDLNEPVNLTKREQELYNILIDFLVVWKKMESGGEFVYKEKLEDLWKEVTNKAPLSFELYKSLKERGIEVKYGKHLLRNRIGDSISGPEQLEFHDHIDCIDHLIQFIQFPEIHNEVGDVTLGVKFEIKIYCHHRNRGVAFNEQPFETLVMLRRIDNGWHVLHWELNTKTDQQCSALINHLYRAHGVSCPNQVSTAFEYLWDEAANGLGQGDLKLRLDEIAKWISAAEKCKPDWI